MARKVNLGCGKNYREGYLNCDVNPRVRADLYFDLEVFPYPLETSSATEIVMDNVLEHLGDIPRVLSELHRILVPGGVLQITVPYAKSDWAYQDPTHKHYFTERSMDYFTVDGPYDFYGTQRFHLRRAELVAHDRTARQRLRNLVPFRSFLRFWLFNMYDVVEFELVKVDDPVVAEPKDCGTARETAPTVDCPDPHGRSVGKPALPEAAWYDVHYRAIQREMPDWYKFMLPDLLPQLTSQTRLLELGCGQGHLLRFLVEQRLLQPAQIYAIDQSETAVEFVRAKLPNAHVRVGDIRNIDSTDDHFDIVVLMETIEHVEDPLPLLREIVRVLKPGGVLYVSFPNYLHLPWLLVRILAEKLNRPNWIVLQPIDKIYSLFQIRRIISKSGMRFERGFGSIYGPPLLYRYEPPAMTSFLNSIGLYALSFHPILRFRKPQPASTP